MRQVFHLLCAVIMIPIPGHVLMSSAPIPLYGNVIAVNLRNVNSTFPPVFKPGQALHITANPSTVVNVIGTGMVNHECVGVAQFSINRLQYFTRYLGYVRVCILSI